MVSEAALGLPSVADNCGGATLVRAGVPAGNLFPVGLTAVIYTATDSGGATATAATTVHVRNAAESLAAIAAELETILASSTRPALSRRIEDALARVRRAIAELAKRRPTTARQWRQSRRPSASSKRCCGGASTMPQPHATC